MNFFRKHKVLTVLLSLLLVLLLGGFAFVWTKLDLIQYHSGHHEPSSSVTVPEPSVPDEPLVDDDDLIEQEIIRSNDEIFSDSDVFNILLLGTDERKAEFQTFARADSIMILSLNHRENTIKLVSIQRGTGVEILDNVYDQYDSYVGQYDWITHCFQYGGASLMLQEIQEFYKVDVDRYVRVNFNTFTQIIDALGGVDIELSELEAKGLNGEVYTNATTKHKVTAGLNHLDGYDALQYARLRFIDSDWQRIERQRNVIQSIVKSAKEASLLELNDMMDKVLPLVQTNLTKGEMLNLLRFAPAVLGQDFEQMSVPVKGTYGSMTGMQDRILYSVDFDRNAEILRDFLYGTNDDTEGSSSGADPERDN